jgi:hypothetical protein
VAKRSMTVLVALTQGSCNILSNIESTLVKFALLSIDNY